jgi:hypothetical protein
MREPERPRTGLTALKARVKLKGLAAIDMRTAAARSLLAWRGELVDALGGEGTVTPQQRRLVELAVRASMYTDHADAILLERNSLVTRRGKFIALVAQRTQLADHVVNILSKLGLERRRPPVVDIARTIQEQRKRAKKNGGPWTTAAPPRAAQGVQENAPDQAKPDSPEDPQPPPRPDSRGDYVSRNLPRHA